MQSRFLDSIIFSKEKAEFLKQLRIINQNLVHVEGLPKNLLKVSILKSREYFGQYGKIKNIILSRKINPESNNEIFSVYITYDNKLEAACAILCVDSLLICGKIIRAFYGTTKYCNYFLDNTKCKNLKKCLFLHELVTNEDIIIGPNTNFSYNEHLNMSRKIIEQNKLEIKKIILKKSENSKNILPSIDFIFLSEDEKVKYLEKSEISYVRSSDNRIIDTSTKNNYIINNIYNINNLILGINNNNKFQIDELTQSDKKFNKIIWKTNNFENFISKHSVNFAKYQDPVELCNLFKDSIKHILLSKSYFSNIKNIPLKKLELLFFRDDLLKKGIDINFILDGCLDCVNDCL